MNGTTLRQVRPISVRAAKAFCCQWHYCAGTFPPHCLLALGFEDEKGLAGVALWGWGVRPLHTIQKLFPPLGTGDYLELNRLACRDEMPRNTESWFLARCTDWIKANRPELSLLISWADGIRGKPGYVYQASGFLYGGFIQTEIYLTPAGEPVHPRLLITRHGSRSKSVTNGLGLRKVWGRQFIYARFLCSHAERKRLLRASTLDWRSRDYPKRDDLIWKIEMAGEVSRETRDAPSIQGPGRFRHPAPTLFDKKEAA